MGQDNQPRLIRVDTLDRVEYPIAEGTTRIGRSRGFPICLEDRAVSRFHCYLKRDGDTVRIFNGESKNPARVNGEEVRGQILRTGHAIRIGHCELVYEGPLPAVEDMPPGSELAAAPARAAAGPGSRPRAFTPRRPAARRSRGAPTGWIITALVAFPLLVWLVVAYVPRVTETPAASPDAGQAAARLRRLEEELGRLRGELTGKLAQKEPGRAETEHVAVLTQRIKDLEVELTRQRSEAPAAVKSDATRAATAAAAGEVALPDAELDSAPEVASIDDLRPRTGGTTVVAADSSRRVKRSPGEIRDLVARLTTRLDDYATHLVTPAKLDPELRDLSLSPGKAAAEGLLDVHDHARQLLRVTDASIAQNERRREAMLKKAATSPQGTSGKGEGDREEAPKKPGEYEKPVSHQVEVDQRLLDLFAKAASIHRQHRAVLVSLRGAILTALGRLTDTEAVRRLRARFGDESGDPELCAALTSAMKDSGLREHIPALYRKLGVTGDATLRAAIRGALVALAGKDLGDEAPAWARWWVEEGSK
jgi:hypothetical protein